MSIELRLVVAGFDSALAQHEPHRRLPLLERWLARGAHRIAVQSMPYARVARWQAMLLESADPALAPADFASAPVSWLGGDGRAFAGVCMHADPVYIETLMDRLRLACPAAFDPAQARQLLQELSSPGDPSGYRFDAPAGDRWFLCVPGRLEVETVPLEAALGTDLRETLPTGRDAVLLRRLMNEVQMLLHTDQVNVANPAAGQLPANGLWFWGQGSVPTGSLPATMHLFGDDPYVRGLARLQGRTARPAEHARLASIDPSDGSVSVAVRIGGLGELERDWLVPLTEDLRAGRYAHVALGLESRWVTVTPKCLRRFWRRDRDLAEWRR